MVFQKTGLTITCMFLCYKEITFRSYTSFVNTHVFLNPRGGRSQLRCKLVTSQRVTTLLEVYGLYFITLARSLICVDVIFCVINTNPGNYRHAHGSRESKPASRRGLKDYEQDSTCYKDT